LAINFNLTESFADGVSEKSTTLDFGQLYERQHMSHLSIPQLRGLATWSFGMVMTHSSSVDRISEFIAQINSEKPNTVRQRLCIVVSKLKSKKREQA